MGALFSLIKNTASHTHLLQQIIFLHHQQIILKLLEIPPGIHIIDFGKNPADAGIILMYAILIAYPPLPVGHEGKRQNPILKRGQFFAEIPVPGVVSAVRTDQPVFMQLRQILLPDRKRDHDLNIGKIFPEILLPDPVGASHRPDGIQHRRFSGIVFPNQNQGILHIRQSHLPYPLKIPYSQKCDLHPTDLLFFLHWQGL